MMTFTRSLWRPAISGHFLATSSGVSITSTALSTIWSSVIGGVPDCSIASGWPSDEVMQAVAKSTSGVSGCEIRARIGSIAAGSAHSMAA